MRFSPLSSRLVGAALLSLCVAGTAVAQSFSPAAPKRHYTSAGKAYFRGPTRLTFGLGTGYYNGDISSSVSDQFFAPAASLGFLNRYSPHLGLAIEASFARVGAKDHLPARGLAFNTNAYTVAGLMRWYPVADRTAYAGGGGGPVRVLPFVQGGLGLTLYSAESYIGVTRTPATNSVLPAEVGSYPDLTISFPVGAGFTVHCTDALNLSLEGNYYFLTTDTFDDISKRLSPDGQTRLGNPDKNDAFGTLMLKAEIKLN